MVVSKFIKDGYENKIKQNTLIVKYSGDSANVTRSRIKILNFAMTLMNDDLTAKSVNGTFDIGK
jgi:hypothetical protein